MTSKSKFDPNRSISEAFYTDVLPAGAMAAPDDEVEEMFDFVLSQDLGNFADTMEDIYYWWEKKGFITERQYDVLRSAYVRHGGSMD